MDEYKTHIPYGYQNINDNDIKSVVDVLRSDFLTQGAVVPRFEEKVADFCQAKYSIAVNSATSALHIACLALDVGVGDCVWTSATTFVASANCALYCGAEVDFIDIDPRTFNIDVLALKNKLIQAKNNNRLPKVVVAVHMCGQPCNMVEISALSKEFGFRIIEDAAHAIGSEYKGQKTGACQYSDITVFSFHPVKIITTAEGGMALTNNEMLAKTMQLLRNHGISRDEAEMINEPTGEWYYEQLILGFNYRMTELQAALGISQMDRIDEFVSKRHLLANHYQELLKHLPIDLPVLEEECYSSFHLYVIRLKLNKIKLTHREIFTKLRAARIGVNLHYMPVYLQPYYQRDDISNGRFVKGYCPEAEAYAETAISIPLYPFLTTKDQQRVADELEEILCQ
jgi:UDP-4-amino-4,6-dideoxy-N-acetyl-beta-L-altrosamine transaminase